MARKRNKLGELEKQVSDAISGYSGEDTIFALLHTKKQERVAVITNHVEKAEALMTFFVQTDLGHELLLSCIKNLIASGNNDFAEEVSDMLGETDEPEVRTEPNALCETCVLYTEKSCGFGHCRFLKRDIDGKNTNEKNTVKGGCKKYGKRYKLGADKSKRRNRRDAGDGRQV